MQILHMKGSAALLLAFALGAVIIPSQADEKRHDSDKRSENRILIGFKIAPVKLNLHRKNPLLVGLGSYIVNAQGGCNDCHTNPPYAAGGDPFKGEPTQINAEKYLAGGVEFGPGIVSKNLTPDENGKPAGLTFEQFKDVLRTGRDPDDPTRILQVMPWPVYGRMTNTDLRAVYEYLRSIPSIPEQ